MNNNQKKIIIAGIKSAGIRIKELIGQINKKSMTKITPFDYGIPADKKAEKIIQEAINKSNLDCKIISEESDVIGNNDAKYTVFLDPLDGSINFSRKIPVFCVGLGIYQNNNPVLGVVYDISMNELFVAEAGNGITLNGESIKPNTFESNILINFEWFGAPLYEEIASKLKKANIRARTAGSGVLALCYGCIGRGDGAILIDNKPWDIAPGMVFAKENGYIIKQFNNQEVDLSIHSQNIIAAPKKIFDKLIKSIK
ncbi:inositol monophosphatase [Candidatus Shapirobacteria bacterium]|nr:inositol monophosphatase [Candidatus Shapirobacteria bacterium]